MADETMGQNAPDINAPLPGGGGPTPGTPAPPAATPTPAAQQIDPSKAPAPPPAKPGSFFGNLSHAFMGAVLGGLAGTKEDVAQYHADPDTGTLTPMYKDPATGQLSTQRQDMHPREQLAKIAHSALRGLAEVAAYGPMGGAAMAIAQPKMKDDRMRAQAETQFEDEQKAMFNKVNNAHILMENVKATRDLATSDLATNQHAADIGNNVMEAAVEGGNKVVGDAHMTPAQLTDFRAQHPEYLSYTPLITQATLAVDDNGQPVTDLKTGVQKVNLGYSLVDMKSPIAITDTMISHLTQMGIPGADKLTAGQKIDPTQFQALYFNGLQAYNEANRDSKNNEVIEGTDAQGNLVKTMVNKVTKDVTPLIDPTTKQPIGGKVETEIHTIFNPATQKNEDYLVKKSNGQHITYLGENKSDMNSVANSIGDFSKTGEAYLATTPMALRGVIKSVANYGMKPADLGRAQNRLQILEAAGQYNGQPLDEKTYQLRFNYMSDYQDSKGAEGLARASGNTAIGHLDQLAMAGEALAQNNLQALNVIATSVGAATGNAAPAIYDNIAYKAAGEAARAVQGGVPNQAETDKLYSQLEAKLSPAQRAGVINSQFRLILTPMENMKTRFTENMGQTPEALGRPVLNATSQAILQKYGITAPNPTGQNEVLLQQKQGPNGHLIGYSPSKKAWVDAKTLQPLAPITATPQGAK